MVDGQRNDGSKLPQKIRLAEWVLDPESGELQRPGECQHLEPKMAEVLVYLVLRAGQVVSKDELLREVWADTVVAESSLWRSIAGLRKALGDDHHTPSFIETLPRRGYRLIAKIEPAAAASLPGGANPSSTGSAMANRPGLLLSAPLLAAATVAITAGLWAYLSLTPEPHPTAVPSVLHPPTAADASARQLYSHALDYFYRYSEEGTRQAIRLFELAIRSEPDLAVAHAGLADAQVFQALNFGGDLEAGLLTARHSLTLDPRSAAAHKALGFAYQAHGWLHRAAASYRRALDEEPRHVAAANNLAVILMQLGQPDQALELLRTMQPIGAESAVINYFNRAHACYLLDRLDYSRQLVHKTLEIDPTYIPGLWLDSWLDVAAGRTGEAGRKVESALQALPESPVLLKLAGEIALLNGDPASSRRYLEKALGDQPWNDPDSIYLAWALQQTGDRVRARELREALAEVARDRLGQGDELWSWPLALAAVAAAESREQSALEWLDQAIVSGLLHFRWLAIDPAFSPVIEDPRFVRRVAELELKILERRRMAGESSRPDRTEHAAQTTQGL